MSKKIKVAIVITHPIQYYASVFAALAAQPEIELLVLYTQGKNYASKKDRGFGQMVTWDIPLLKDYPYRFLNNISWRPSNSGFFGIINTNLRTELKKFSADFVICYGYSYWSHLMLILFPRGMRVILRGDSTLMNFRNSLKDKVKSFVLRNIFSHLYAAFYVGKKNLDYLNFYAPVVMKHYVPHTINNAEFNARIDFDKSQVLHDKYAMHRYKRVFVFVGKLIALKNVGLICDVISQYFPQVLLMVVGAGEQSKELNVQYGTAKNVIFTGFVNQMDIATYINVADVLVLPSANETWGFVINEAMALGKPCIVSDRVGSADDLVKNFQTGYVFKLEDRLSLKDAVEQMLVALDAGEIQKNVKRHIAEYDNMVQVENLLTFFKKQRFHD